MQQQHCEVRRPFLAREGGWLRWRCRRVQVCAPRAQLSSQPEQSSCTLGRGARSARLEGQQSEGRAAGVEDRPPPRRQTFHAASGKPGRIPILPDRGAARAARTPPRGVQRERETDSRRTSPAPQARWESQRWGLPHHTCVRRACMRCGCVRRQQAPTRTRTRALLTASTAQPQQCSRSQRPHCSSCTAAARHMPRTRR